jgi:hypothetical protein
MAFWEGPILTKIRRHRSESCEFVFLGAMVPGPGASIARLGIRKGEE